MSDDDLSGIDFPGGVGMLPLGDLATRSGLDILLSMLRSK